MVFTVAVKYYQKINGNFLTISYHGKHDHYFLPFALKNGKYTYGNTYITAKKSEER